MTSKTKNTQNLTKEKWGTTEPWTTISDFERSSKLFNKLFINKIEDTEFYHLIMANVHMEHKNGAKVANYKLKYTDTWDKNKYIEISGKGDIAWKRIEGAINDHNLTEYNLHKKNNRYYAFHVDIDTLYLPAYLLLGLWSGRIMFTNGECIHLMEDVAPYGGGFRHVGIRRYSAKIETVTEDFSFKVNKGKAYYFPCVR